MVLGGWGQGDGGKSENRTETRRVTSLKSRECVEKKERESRKTESDPSAIEQYGQESPLD